ncbi:hypothetical protein MNBD_GAMMA09-1020 [hydrothermal vent metagenome]|uniref:Uncharacterized protein n=1 Tax=hydrothermal vent metagenome TaxID=652676 RepID=A0A3B0XND9_9ZZZZ
MNRTFLILLMIGTAMMITVISQHKSVNNLDYMPWEVDRLENGSIRVFAITLGKTTIQEANQIFASFAQTRLIQNDSIADRPAYQLIARYNDLSIGGLIAEVQLQYQLDEAQLLALLKNLEISDSSEFKKAPDENIKEYKIDQQTEMSYLSTPIAGITYIPFIDYGKETIRQRFGLATKELTINKNEEQWLYPELDLKIFIYADRPDRFVYYRPKNRNDASDTSEEKK